MRKINFIFIHCTAFLSNISERGFHPAALDNYLNNYLFQWEKDEEAKAEKIKKFHIYDRRVDNGLKMARILWHEINQWKNPGYRKMIMYDGSVIELAKQSKVTNGVAGFNSNAIHLAYDGGVYYNGDRQFVEKDTRSPEQKRALREQIKIELQEILKHQDFLPDIVGHNWADKNKACPCFDAKKEYQDILLEYES